MLLIHIECLIESIVYVMLSIFSAWINWMRERKKLNASVWSDKEWSAIDFYIWFVDRATKTNQYQKHKEISKFKHYNKHKVLRRWQPHYIIYTAIHLSKSNVIAITISSARLIIFILFIILIRFCAIKGANTAATTSQSQQTQCYWLN